MAVERKAALTNIDSGGFFYLSNQDKGNSTYFLPDASRYTDLNTIINVLDEKYWAINSFGDQQYTLADQKFGYKISDRLWAMPEQALDNSTTWNYPNTPGEYEGNIQQRRAVMYSVGEGAYIWIDPTTLGYPPEDMVFAWVANPYQATRFSNINDFKTIMEGSTLGNAVYGWLIQEYVFTKGSQEFVPTDQTFHVPANAGSSTIERRFITYSSTLGKYLWIDNPLDPIEDMVIQFTESHMQATRFTDVNDIKDIINGTAIFDTRFRQGWDLIQFLFTSPVVSPTPDPWVEWVGNEATVSSKLVILDPGDGGAPYKSTEDFVLQKAAQREYDPSTDDPRSATGLQRYVTWMTPYLNQNRQYVDSKAAQEFLGKTDSKALTIYLTDIYNSIWIG